MRPTQTLDEALTDGQNAIGPLLEQWLAQEQSTRQAGGKRPGPYEIRVGFQAPGEARKPTTTLAWSAEQAIPAAVRPLMEQAAEDIRERHGPSPMGKLRFQVYHAGESGKTERNFMAERAIAPGDDVLLGGAGDVVWLRTQNAQLHNSVVAMAAHLQTALTGSMTLNAEQAQSMATLATARTAGSAAADAGSIWGIASLVLLGVSWPLVQNALGQKGRTLPEMLQLFQARIALAISGDKARAPVDEVQIVGQPPPPPPGIVDVEATTVHTGAAADADPLTPRRAIERAQVDPSWLQELVGLIRSDPRLQSEALAAFTAAPAA